MNELFACLMVTAITAIIGAVAIAFLNFLLKRRIIKSGLLDEKYLQLLTNQENKLAALKWGIIFLFSGLGLIVIGLLPYQADTSPIPWGVEVIFTGLGFLVYYLLVRKDNRP
jgi:dolichol kinase